MSLTMTLFALSLGLTGSSYAVDSGAVDSGAVDSEVTKSETSDAGTSAADPSDSKPREPHPLSVAPLSQVEYPDERPVWVDAPPTFGESVDPGATDVWPVKSLLRPTAEEARESLQVQIRGAAAAYAEQFLGSERVKALPELTQLYPELEASPAADRYAGTALLGDQKVYEEAVRLRFDERYRQQLATAWRQAEVARRLSFLGVAGVGGFVLLFSATGLVRRIARRRVETLQ